MLHSERQLHMTPKVLSLIFLIEECLASGEIDSASFSCRYTTLSSFNFPRNERIRSFHWSKNNLGIQSYSNTAEMIF